MTEKCWLGRKESNQNIKSNKTNLSQLQFYHFVAFPQGLYRLLKHLFPVLMYRVDLTCHLSQLFFYHPSSCTYISGRSTCSMTKMRSKNLSASTSTRWTAAPTSKTSIHPTRSASPVELISSSSVPWNTIYDLTRAVEPDRTSVRCAIWVSVQRRTVSGIFRNSMGKSATIRLRIISKLSRTFQLKWIMTL